MFRVAWALATAAAVARGSEIVDAFPRKLSGLPPAKTTPMVVLLAGWPDDTSSFDEIVPAFAATHTVVSLALPGYEGPPVSERWGLSFEVLIEKLQETIASVGGPEKYYLVGHDWGAYLCTLYAEDHADEVLKLGLLDVGADEFDDVSKKELAVILTYQLYFAKLFVLDALGVPRFATTFLFKLFPFQSVGPVPYETKLPTAVQRFFVEPDFRMMYPYFQSWKGVWKGEMVRGSPMPTQPVLFMYGANKRTRFHTKGFLAKLDARDDGSKWVELDCGHWVQTQKPKEVSDELARFIAEPAEPAEIAEPAEPATPVKSAEPAATTTTTTFLPPDAQKAAPTPTGGASPSPVMAGDVDDDGGDDDDADDDDEGAPAPPQKEEPKLEL
mmetsp:Transcript_16836/g.51058  ORF Transcript_16836/g.51058 Transcript_16836/m.51058 type:complete len:385 (-) Transcript_16836:43-1197(-)